MYIKSINSSGGSFSTPMECNDAGGWTGSGYTGGSVIDSNSGTYYSYSSGCTICATGTFKASTGSASCTACVAGKHSSATGATSDATCIDCEPGKIGNTEGSTFCTTCSNPQCYSAAPAAPACTMNTELRFCET